MTKLSKKLMYLLKHIIKYTLTSPIHYFNLLMKNGCLKICNYTVYLFSRVTEFAKMGKICNFYFNCESHFMSFVHLNSFLIATVPDMIFSELWFFCDVKVIKKGSSWKLPALRYFNMSYFSTQTDYIHEHW